MRIDRRFATRGAIAAALLATGFLAGCGRNNAKDVASFSNDISGNAIEITALADPQVAGVTCHLAHFSRSFIDRVWNGNFFEDPSNASIACRQTGPITIGKIDRSANGEEIFSQRQSLVFKSLAVRRIYDAANQTLVYVSYSREPVRGSAKMAISTVSLYGQNVKTAATGQ